MSTPRPGDRLSPADLVTIANAVLGFLAIAVLIRSWALDPNELADGIQADELKLAGGLIICGALCDVVDGFVARATWSSGLGDHLDGMADAITFGVAPALLVAVVGFGYSSPLDALALAAATTHVVTVVVRLARHAAAEHSPEKGFVGVPSPTGAIGVIGVIALDLGPAPTITGIFAVSALMLAGFRYPHQTRPAAMAVLIVFVCLAVGAVSGLVPLRLAGGLALFAVVAIPLAIPADPSARRPPAGAPTSRSA